MPFLVKLYHLVLPPSFFLSLSLSLFYAEIFGFLMMIMMIWPIWGAFHCDGLGSTTTLYPEQDEGVVNSKRIEMGSILLESAYLLYISS